MIDSFLSPKDAARRLGISRGMVYQLIRRGSVQAVRHGRNAVRISENSLNAYLDRCRIIPIGQHQPVTQTAA